MALISDLLYTEPKTTNYFKVAYQASQAQTAKLTYTAKTSSQTTTSQKDTES